MTEFARIYLGVEPTARAGAHPAHRALRDGRHPHRRRRPGGGGARRDAGARACTRPGEMRLRERPRREPAGDELAARHRGVRPAGRGAHGRVRARTRPSPTSPTTPSPRTAESSAVAGCSPGRERLGRRHPGRAPGADVRPGRRGSDREDGLRQDAGPPGRPPRALRAGRGQRQGQGVQHRADGGGRARVPARPGRHAGRRRPGPGREPGRRTTARITPCATTTTGSSTRWPYRAARRRRPTSSTRT